MLGVYLGTAFILIPALMFVFYEVQRQSKLDKKTRSTIKTAIKRALDSTYKDRK